MEGSDRGQQQSSNAQVSITTTRGTVQHQASIATTIADLQVRCCRLSLLLLPFGIVQKEVIDTANMSARFVPRSSLEAKVASIIESSGITEKGIIQAQELEFNKLSTEEVHVIVQAALAIVWCCESL
jgi:hypothetical protein